MRVFRWPSHSLFVPDYHRRLPHIYQIGQPVFVTWRLAGSLPDHRYFSPKHLTGGQAFAAFDHLLDTARTGPLYLNHPDLAAMVTAHLKELAQSGKTFEMHSFAVMPNHVHVLITPAIPLPKIMKLVKGGTARRANQIMNTPGRTFWQDEFFDHYVRNQAEFRRICNYIEFNPVRAGLSASPEDFLYSSAWRGERG